jgi:hypothetical protein
MFFALKHWLGGFCYHFWTQAVPKLKRGETLDPTTCSPEARQQLAQTLDTIERFVNLAGMALGLLQYRVCPTFYTLCTLLILGPLPTNSAMSKERYLIA